MTVLLLWHFGNITFPIAVIYSVVVYLGWLCHHMLHIGPGKAGFSFLSLLCMLCYVQIIWVHYGLKVLFVCLHMFHYHYSVDLSEIIEYIKCSLGIFLWSVCLRLSPFSESSFMQYIRLIVFVRVSHETKVCTVCLTITTDTWRNNNVIITSKRRCDVVLT